jgi:hypothetical protein
VFKYNNIKKKEKGVKQQTSTTTSPRHDDGRDRAAENRER